MRLKMWLCLLMVLIASGPVQAYVAVNSGNPVHVVGFGPRNAGLTAGAGQQYFLIALDVAFSYTCPGQSTPVTTGWVAVPRLVPNADNTNGPAENPAYRDYVNSATIAKLEGFNVWIYIDGCIDSIPRLVGLTVA